MLTVAPGTTAPLGSLMVPRKEVLAFWEKLFEAKATNRKTRATLQHKRLVTDFLQITQRKYKETAGSSVVIFLV